MVSVDLELVEAAQRGDQVAFVDLVRLRGDRLFAIAHRIVHGFGVKFARAAS